MNGRRRASVVDTIVNVTISYPHGGDKRATLHVTDGPSGFEVLTVDLTPDQLLNMLASQGDIARIPAVFRGIEHVGRQQEHDTVVFLKEPTEGELLDLQGDDWYVSTPHRNNRAQWIVTRRRYRSLTTDRSAS